jgi:hypothetical protein
MAVDLRCPECGDNFGKDVENALVAYCSDCRLHFYNERGERDGSEEEAEFLRKRNAARNKKFKSGRLISRW